MQSSHNYSAQGIAIDQEGQQISPFKYSEKSPLSKNTSFAIRPSSSPEEESYLTTQFKPMSNSMQHFNSIDVTDRASSLVKSISEKERELTQLNATISAMQIKQQEQRAQQEKEYTQMQKSYDEKVILLKIEKSKVDIDRQQLQEKESKYEKNMRELLDKEKRLKQEEMLQLEKGKQLAEQRKEVETARIELQDKIYQFNVEVEQFKKEKMEYDMIVKQKIEKMDRIDQTLISLGKSKLLDSITSQQVKTPEVVSTSQQPTIPTYKIKLDISSYSKSMDKYTPLFKEEVSDLPGSITIKQLVDSSISLDMIMSYYDVMEAAVKDKYSQKYKMLDIHAPISQLSINDEMVEVVLIH